MRIGIHVKTPAGDANVIDSLLAEAREAHRLGLESWMPQTDDVDALTTLTIVGREFPGLPVGTSCVPIWPRHPMVVAMQALTAQAATGNRLTLGVGLSHRVMIEGPYGISFDKPVRYMREYLETLVPLLHQGEADYQGELLAAKTARPVRLSGAEPPTVLVAALGRPMLNVAGRLAEGTLLWMVGPRTLASHIVPHLTAAADAAGRGRPQVVVSLPVCVTSDPDSAGETVAGTSALYGELPSYRAVLDLEGAAGPAGVAVVGDEESVESQLRELEEARATAISLRPFGSPQEHRNTLALLSGLARAHA
jgi:F420-dependent oxidoreductase-like protein